MPTAKKIADIKANLLHPALTSHFEVEIPIPLGLINNLNYLSGNGLSGFKGSSGKQGQLQLMCSEATLPGSNLATFEINDNFHGVTERHAYRRVYDDRIDLTFYVDAENYLPIRFFEAWIKYISGEQLSPKNNNVKQTNYFYRMNYPKNYIANSGLEVTKFEKSTVGNSKGKKAAKLQYFFVDAFPISINSISVSYDTASLLKCSVAFSYVRYYINPVGEQAESEAESSPYGTRNFSDQIQQVKFNANAFNSGLDFGGGNIPATTTNGINLAAANASGNTVQTAFSGRSII